MKKLSFLILLISAIYGCGQKQTVDNQATEGEVSQTDSSFTAFLANFKTVSLPYRQDSTSIPALGKKVFIKDYFLRNFLANDKISNVEGYLAEYTNAMNDESPWNFAWYDCQFAVNEQITAIVYHTYKQISASNGGSYQSMLATFDKSGKMVSNIEIAEQSIYQSSNLIANEAEEYSTFSSVYATVRTEYEISKDSKANVFKISILQMKNEEINQEIQDTSDSTLLAKNSDPTFAKQVKTPELVKKTYQIAANGEIIK